MDIDVSLILQSLGTVRKFADPEGPLAGRKLAAGGALPLPPEQATQVLFCLTFDPDAEVQAKAKQSLDALPDRVLDQALVEPIHWGVLDHFVHRFRENADKLEKIALNPATSDETFCMLAGLPQPRVIQIVSHYQTRLLRCPQLVEALSENPIASGATLDRVLEFLGISTTSPAPVEEAEVPVVEEPLANTAAEGAEAFDPEDTSEIPEELLVDREDEGEEDEQQMQSLFSQVQKMNVLEKIKLARFGNGESRSLARNH